MNRVAATRTLLGFLVLFVTCAAPAAAEADESFASEIEGTYEAEESKKKARKKIDEELKKVIAKMYFFKRPFARPRLKSATEPCQTMRFVEMEDKISIQCDDRNPAISRPDGTETRYKADDGDVHELTQKVEEDRIVQTFVSDNGTRTNVYKLENGDTLVMDVKLEASALPEPVTYTREFERNED